MNKIKLNKKFYPKSALDKAIKDFRNMVQVTEEEAYYLIFSEDKTTLFEFSNYVFAIR